MKTPSFRLVAAIFTLALSSGVVAATGCGTSAVTSLCDDICACQRCTSNDLQTCQDKGRAAADAADAAGCGSQFDELVACSSAHITCKGDNAVADGCDAEVNALTKCSSTLSVFGKNACQLAADKLTAQLAACPNPPMNTTTTGSGGQAECTDAAGKLATCQVAALAGAPCACLGLDNAGTCTSEQSKALSDAITACQ